MTRDSRPEATRTLTVNPADAYGREILERGAGVGPYTVEGVAAVGGFGVVYRARARDGRAVAVKVLHPSISTDVRALSRFQREVELIQRSRHPNIVEILSFGELSSGCPYIACEWLDGVTLSEHLAQRGPLDPDTALAIMDGLSSALSAVHASGVVHRDLKGSNIMLVPDGDGQRVKLLDFGIAKRLDHDLKLTRTGHPIGTPGYMAPEQLEGRLVGPPTDIYTAGILLFMMLTGEHPRDYGAEAETTSRDDLARSMPVRLYDGLLDADEVASIPPPVREVIARCVAPKACRRYPSIEEMMADLQRAAGSWPRETPPERRAITLRTEVKSAAAMAVTITGGSESEVRRAREARTRMCEADGFIIAGRGERSFLSLATLPDDAEPARTVRERFWRLALRLAGTEPASGLVCSVTVHTGPAVVLFVGSAPQFTGGELLESDDWAHPASQGAVFATDVALEGIEEVFAAESVPPSTPVASYFAIRVSDPTSPSAPHLAE